MVAPTVCNVGAEDYFGPWADVVIRPYGAGEQAGAKFAGGVEGAAPYIFLFLHSEEKTGHITLGRSAKGQPTPRRRTRTAARHFVKCITGKMRTTRAKGEGCKRNFGFFPYIIPKNHSVGATIGRPRTGTMPAPTKLKESVPKNAARSLFV